MTEPSSQHLYVMQNEYGCIKIGRSIDPWKRRLDLCRTECCQVELIAAFEKSGEDEEVIHVELESFRLEGEWFDGVENARRAIEYIFGIDPAEWKFAHDPNGADQWINHLRVVRDASYIRRALSREIGILRTATGPSWVYDSSIFQCRHLAETGKRVGVLASKRKGQTVCVWYNSDTKNEEVVPAYTARVEEALLAWPDKLRPETWQGSPIECCIAALNAIRLGLPKVPRRAN